MNRYKFVEEPHGHWLDGKPLIGITTSLGIISKELSFWASGMAVGELGWKNPKRDDNGHYIQGKENLEARNRERIISAGEMLTKIKFMTIGEYQNLLDKAYRAHDEKKKSRALEGTDLHSWAEIFIKRRLNNNFTVSDLPGHLLPFINWCDKNVKKFIFSEIHCWSEKLWCGGKTDFAYEDNYGNIVLADIKSRNKDYFSDHVQMGGYNVLLEENGGYDAEGNKIWDYVPFNRHAVFTLGDNFKEPAYSYSVFKNKESFEHALGLYKNREAHERMGA